MNVPTPPTVRGASTVWMDDVRFIGFGTPDPDDSDGPSDSMGPVLMDWDDEVVDGDVVSFEGFSKWRVDDSLPGPKTGSAIHSPKGLLPGEYSTLSIKHSSARGGKVSFDFHLGLGTMYFLIDGEVKYSEARPGQGTKTKEFTTTPGEHTYSWKYEPPPHANMPMSMVWIDNVNLP